jgi:sugar (pentulose or hexulose) kinase
MSIIAIDIGTSAIKGLIADWDGAVRGSASVGTPTRRPLPGSLEFPLEEVYPVCSGLIRRLGATLPGDPADTLAFSCLGTAMAPVDSAGNTLGPALSPVDPRSRSLRGPAGPRGLDPAELRRRTGQNPELASFLGQWIWWKEERPTLMAKAKRFLSPRGFLLRRLCGVNVEDYSLASRSMLFDLEQGAWSEQVCSAVGLDLALLPELHPATASWEIDPSRVEELGLAPGCRAVLGGMDNCCAFLGSTAPDEARLVNITGTYEHLAGVTGIDESRSAAEAVGGLVFHYLFPGSFLACSRSAVGYLLNRLSAATARPLEALLSTASRCGEVEAVHLSEGALEARLSSGVSPSNVASGLLRSAGEVLRQFLVAWRDHVEDPESIVVIGGGATASEPLRCKARLLCRSLTLLEERESAALGALRLGAMAVKDLELDEACHLFGNPVRQVLAYEGKE